MGRVIAAMEWAGIFDVAAMASSVSDSMSRIWISLLQIPLSFRWTSGYIRWWPLFDLQSGLSAIESVLWSVIVAVESVALASLLCFFFLFCGCNL